MLTLLLLASMAGVPSAGASFASLTITSAGPLSNIWIGDTLDCQVEHVAHPNYQFFPAATAPGDCGTFVATGGALYGPDFAANGATATGALGAYTLFTPAGQAGVFGTGTAATPFTIVTTVTLGASGITVTETDQYVVGDDFYTTTVEISTVGLPMAGVLYHAADCHLMGDDSGFGAVGINGPGSVACTENANNAPAGDYEEFVPLTPGSAFYEDFYGAGGVWSWIATQTMFPNTCTCATYLDNGIGLSWDFVVDRNQPVRFMLETRFAPPQVALTARCEAHAVLIRASEGFTGSTFEQGVASSAATTTAIPMPLPPPPPPGAPPSPPPAPTAHADAEEVGFTYTNTGLGISVDARGVFSQCDLAAYLNPTGGLATAQAYGRAGIADLTIQSGLGTLLHLEALDFELDARGAPFGTNAFWACDTVEVGTLPGTVSAVCPLIAGFATVCPPGLSFVQPQVAGPALNAFGEWEYEGAYLHLRIDTTPCMAPGAVLDVYVGYVRVAVGGGPAAPPVYVPNGPCLTAPLLCA